MRETANLSVIGPFSGKPVRMLYNPNAEQKKIFQKKEIRINRNFINNKLKHIRIYILFFHLLSKNISGCVPDGFLA